jgi:hypothetical protein
MLFGFCGLVHIVGVWVSLCFWFAGVFSFFFLFHVLASFLYTSYMLRGTFMVFINLSTYL